MKKLLSIFIFTVLATSIFAQREETIIGDAGWGFSGAWGGWNNNIASFNKNYSGYGGGMWNLEFGKRLTVGSSHYTMNNRPLNNTGTTFRLRSNNFVVGYMPMSYRAFHPIINVGVGGGRLSVSDRGDEDRVVTFHPSAGLEFNVTRWCHIDAQVGYRMVTGTAFTGLKDDDFSGVYGQLNLKFGYSWGRYKTSSKRDRDRD
jgi:hypothetical protein